MCLFMVPDDEYGMYMAMAFWIEGLSCRVGVNTTAGIGGSASRAAMSASYSSILFASSYSTAAAMAAATEAVVSSSSSLVAKRAS